MDTVPDQKICRVLTSRWAKTDTASPKLLVVDDCADSLEALVELLSIDGYECETAADGIEAIEQASRLLPDLIVMDISMPRLNGVEAARRLRANAETEPIPMVAYTALDENDVRAKMQDHEFDGYCRKGTNIDCLFWLIDQLLVKCD